MSDRIDPSEIRMRAGHDQSKQLLHTVLKGLGPDAVNRILGQLATDYNEADDMGEKLYAHAALVGMTGAMLDGLEASRLNDAE